MDKWIVGSMTHSEGRRSMYISSDGSNPVYGNRPNVVVSYLRFKFPTATEQQNYDISFDWRGIGDTVNSKLYVMVCPEQMLFNTGTNNYYNINKIVSSFSGVLSSRVVDACEQLGESGERFVCGSERWLNVNLTNEVRVSKNNSNYPFAIVFIWVNGNVDEKVQQTGICIDNLQIGSATLKKPQHVTVEPICEDSTLLVSWEGGQSEYEIQYRQVGSGTWRIADGLMEGVEGFTRTNGKYCSYTLHRIGEGTYDVRVRGKSGDLYTNFTYKHQTLVYCPENHCVDYLNFDSPNVLCTYGYHPLKSSTTPNSPYEFLGYIDYGPDSEESRHTRHVDPTEVDPRTDSCLHTVPPGALASVRLGNWKKGAEAESITYTFTVDSAKQGVLIVRYAVVLENPGGHPHDQEPSFSLVVYDENNNVIDESCGQAVFSYSDGVEAGWNVTKDEKAAWKDWTTIGINLQPYNNQTIKVCFTTYDCSQSGHYGYAYFTVDCASAHLETENCGNDAKIECFAPEGFSYMWFNEAGDVVGEDRELSVNPSRQTYTCRVSFIEDPECFFEVSTISAPRFPVPQYTWEPVYGECLSRLKFHNTSHVMTKYDGDENHTQEPCNDCHWYFERLSTHTMTESYAWSPVYTCPSQGDTIVVHYTCYIGIDNACDSSRVDTIVVPNIIPENTEFSMTTCPESPVNFGGKWFNEDTVYVGVYPNFAGCDSTSTLFLKVYPKPEDLYIHDSICSDQWVTINGVRYNQPLENHLIMLKTTHGCDSALYLSITVNERIKAKVNEVPFICADDEQLFLTFDISAGQYDSLGITFSTPSLRDTMIYAPNLSEVLIPYPATITPGHYTATLTFYQFCCGPYTQVRDIELRYRSSIVEQKWNDVLTLLSPKYNGGYEFTAFQWYKNGEPLPEENHSYLYQPLDQDATYYVELTRADGVVVATCPIQPTYHEQQSDYPTIVSANQQVHIRVEQPTKVYVYSSLGQLVNTYSLTAGEAVFQTPAHAGIYIIRYEAY